MRQLVKDLAILSGTLAPCCESGEAEKLFVTGPVGGDPQQRAEGYVSLADIDAVEGRVNLCVSSGGSSIA
jgi:hypothetical protein